ncbi:ATP-dependent DNA helicase [Trichonephila clavipes]|nr:ATP-dependent DNA helicase [Trichonephila clavipes]
MTTTFSRTGQLQKQLSGQEYAYGSIDCILNDDEAVQYPTEFLNCIQTPDLQAQNLILKVGSPIILIRNIDAPRLCNGTRLIVKKLMQHVIQATVLTGCAKDIKSQDQSLGIAGKDLETPCFSHGQLYVACFRVAKRKIFLYTFQMELPKMLSITLF